MSDSNQPFNNQGNIDGINVEHPNRKRNLILITIGIVVVLIIIVLVSASVLGSTSSTQNTEKNPSDKESEQRSKEEEEKRQKFHIYLSFGQSNMEGNGQIEQEDYYVDERFKMLATVDMPSKGRTKGNWYTAVPPICRENTKLSVIDYFGRSLVEKLPKDVTVGIINVAVGGCNINMFNEIGILRYIQDSQWVQDAAKEYDNNPYRTLINFAKKAQEVGVIKGVIMHHGESDSGNHLWPSYVGFIHEKMYRELGLKDEEVPFFAGEVGEEASGGVAFLHNQFIAKLPEMFSNCHIIKSTGIPVADGLHFTSEGYRTYGKRIAEKVMEVIYSKN